MSHSPFRVAERCVQDLLGVWRGGSWIRNSHPPLGKTVTKVRPNFFGLFEEVRKIILKMLRFLWRIQ